MARGVVLEVNLTRAVALVLLASRSSLGSHSLIAVLRQTGRHELLILVLAGEQLLKRLLTLLRFLGPLAVLARTLHDLRQRRFPLLFVLLRTFYFRHLLVVLLQDVSVVPNRLHCLCF